MPEFTPRPTTSSYNPLESFPSMIPENITASTSDNPYSSFTTQATEAEAALHSPASQLEALLARLVNTGASDIILSEYQGVWVLRYGVAEPVTDLAPDVARTLFFASLESIHTDPAALRGGALETSFNSGDYRFRVSAFTEVHGGRVVLRVLSRDIPDPQAIQVPPRLLHVISSLNQGLILICGPTGSGKTTSIASMLKARGMLRKEHVVMLEDPVEYVMPTDAPTIFSQREIGRDEPSFAQGLKAALRQSPHVIVIGEIRDSETAATALEASETGHLVVATIHASSADMTAQRYIQMVEPDRQDMAREQLASNTEIVVCQRLHKSTTGHRGRVAIHEVMVKTQATTNCIRKGLWAELRNEIQFGAKKGHVTFERSIQALQDAGQISPTEFAEMMERLNPTEKLA